MSRTKHTNYTPSNVIFVVPRRRHYLSASDAVYDFSVGHDFLVRDPSSPFDGCFVSTLDIDVLKRHGYKAIYISYNNGLNVEVTL
jgi:hypothetical protein